MADPKRNKNKFLQSRYSTPEAQIAGAFRAKCRFKALVRFVMQNLYWLDDIEDEEIGDDVQKNIQLITRKKSALTLKDKFILSTPVDQRETGAKLRLDRAIGGLSCFRRYPRHVKSQLIAATRFIYLGPGRTVVRQNQESYGMYFIITGEVVALQDIFDPVLNETVTVTIASMGPGSKFGEIALLHNIPRTATIITKTHCEFLLLTKEDFNTVLRATVQQQWNEVQNAMKLFSYFEHWDDMAIRECCIMSKVQLYTTDETILGDGIGSADYIYFILQGTCQVIEHLLLTMYIRNGRKCYKLYDPLRDSKATPPFNNFKDRKKSKGSSVSQSAASQSTNKTIKELSSTLTKRDDLSEVIDKSGIPQASSCSSFVPSISSTLKREGQSESMGLSTVPSHMTITGSYRKHISTTNLPYNVETHFMQVCILNPKACFGIGENLSRRRVVSITQQTKILLVPRYWLIQRNTGNVWQKVLCFLNNHIPDTVHVFKEFIAQRKWIEYRKQLFNDAYKRNLRNFNSILNVPYSIRIHAQEFE